jgi:hypothetical protein
LGKIANQIISEKDYITCPVFDVSSIFKSGLGCWKVGQTVEMGMGMSVGWAV